MNPSSSVGVITVWAQDTNASTLDDRCQQHKRTRCEEARGETGVKLRMDEDSDSGKEKTMSDGMPQYFLGTVENNLEGPGTLKTKARRNRRPATLRRLEVQVI